MFEKKGKKQSSTVSCGQHLLSKWKTLLIYVSFQDENNNSEMPSTSTSTPVKSSTHSVNVNSFAGSDAPSSEFVAMAAEMTLLSPVVEAPQYHNEIRPEVSFTEAPPVNEVRPEVPLTVQNPVAESSKANQVTTVELSTKDYLKASENKNQMKAKALRSCTHCTYTIYDKATLARHHRRKHGNIKKSMSTMSQNLSRPI